MKLLICLVTYNRLRYTQRTLGGLLSTIKVPHYIVTVDNHSTDDTPKWLKEQKLAGTIDYHILNQGNYYPGKATNMGWGMGIYKYPEATHLMRLDNDMELKEGWDTKAEEYFMKLPTLGQLGLDHEAVEHPLAEDTALTINDMKLQQWPGCVGGPCIIPRRVWDMGLRYDETPWHKGLNGEIVLQEDSKLSWEIKNRGLLVGHMDEDLARTFANETNWHEYPEYYKKTMSQRGYDENVEKICSPS